MDVSHSSKFLFTRIFLFLFNNYHIRVYRVILPHYLDFYSLLVKIILTTQLASTLAIPQCLGGATTVLLTLCLDNLITVYSQTKLYFQVLWLWLFNPSVRPYSEQGCRVPALLSFWLGRRYSSGRFFIVCCHQWLSCVSSQQLFFQAASPVEGSCILLRLCFCLVPAHFMSPCLFPSHPTSPVLLNSTASQLGGVQFAGSQDSQLLLFCVRGSSHRKFKQIDATQRRTCRQTSLQAHKTLRQILV